MKKFWYWRKVEIEPETACAICGHRAIDHNAKVKNKHGEYVIKGCGVIEIARGPHLPWTTKSVEAGQHKPCRCRWDGKSQQRRSNHE
jgi:hypothetical protein